MGSPPSSPLLADDLVPSAEEVSPADAACGSAPRRACNSLRLSRRQWTLVISWGFACDGIFCHKVLRDGAGDDALGRASVVKFVRMKDA